jgi:hypothetical protein
MAESVTYVIDIGPQLSNALSGFGALILIALGIWAFFKGD